MEERAFDTAEAFLDYLRPSRRHWTDNLTHYERVWKFRGQSDASLALVPRAFRPGAFEPYSDQPSQERSNAHEGVSQKTRAAKIVWQARDEIRVLHDFIELADYIGIETPLSEEVIRSIKNHEALLERLAREQLGLPQLEDLEMPPQGLYDSFGLAQHYGLPTRFLDWSYSPLIAAYFAARAAFEERDTEYLAVWALDSNVLFQCQQKVCSDPNQPLFGFTTPYSSNVNMYAQKGFFTVDRQLDQEYLKSGEWRPQDRVIEDLRQASEEPEELLRKLTLPFSEAKALLRALYHEGISPAHLMPSLENVEHTLRYRVKLFGAADKGPLE